MNLIENKKVAEVVAENIKTAHVFKKHGIDFCCGGGITVEKACEKNNVAYAGLKKELEDVDAVVSTAYNYNNWDLSFLVDHIENVHHTYVEENIPLLILYANKVAKVHGHHYAEVIEIDDLIAKVTKELTMHMKKEELILFPYVKQLVQAEKNGTPLSMPHFGSVKDPVQLMEDEHEYAGDIFKKIAKLSNNYTPPEDACNTFKALYAKLEEFEQDLHQHIHLENNILFPKAIQLENRNPK